MIWHFQAIDIDPESETFGMVLFEFDYQKAHPEVSWLKYERIHSGKSGERAIRIQQENQEKIPDTLWLKYIAELENGYELVLGFPNSMTTLYNTEHGHITQTWIQIPYSQFLHRTGIRVRVRQCN